MRPAAATLLKDRDAELLAAVADGNTPAFEELYGIYHRRLLRFVMRLAPRHEIAEEVINDTFWIVWQRAKDFRGSSRVSTWIMGIAYRRALKVLRSARATLPAAWAAGRKEDISLAEPHEETEQRDWIMRGLQQLPAEQRTSMELAYYCGHSCEEIARMMNCGVPAVKTRMFHARKQLRTTLPILAGAAGKRRPSDWVTAVLAAAAVGLWGWMATYWLHSAGSDLDAPYRTVTSASPAVNGEVIHAVFAPGVVAGDFQKLLERAHLKIVAGPSAGGVYSLAFTSSEVPLNVKSTLELLRGNPAVLFVEATAEPAATRHE